MKKILLTISLVAFTVMAAVAGFLLTAIPNLDRPAAGARLSAGRDQPLPGQRRAGHDAAGRIGVVAGERRHRPHRVVHLRVGAGNIAVFCGT